MLLSSKLPSVETTIFTVMSRLAEQHGALNLGQGFPDFDPPPELQAALARHVSSGHNQYAPMAGVLRLREQIAVKLGRDYRVALDPVHEITVTSGATEGIFDAIAAVVGPGDEVVMLDPCYDSYEPAVRLQSAQPIHVPLVPGRFSIDFERLRAALSERTRLVIVNFPHNPSGAVLSAEDLERLAECVRGTNALLLSDEVYEHIVFDGVPQHSLLGHAELRERTFVVGSFGKAYHATGWKVGWVAAPPALSVELRKVHQFVTFSTSTAAQHAFAEVLEADRGQLAALAGFYQRKRDAFRALLAASHLRLLPVAGTYFQLADYSALSNEPDVAFARRLVAEVGVAAIPISVFYAEPPPDQRLIRLCFAKSDATLEEAAARLNSLRAPAPQGG
ncbi:MAG TPA: methionine aminotransferase [Polyangiaceae bacterium]|nr:methionine aminotransferase [Polyangiaceae bacterium]